MNAPIITLEEALTPGSRIRWKRELLGISQAQMGRDLGFNASHLCRVELGRRPLPRDRVAEISEILDCSPHWILTGREASPEVEAALATLLALEPDDRDALISVFVEAGKRAIPPSPALESTLMLASENEGLIAVTWLQADDVTPGAAAVRLRVATGEGYLERIPRVSLSGKRADRVADLPPRAGVWGLTPKGARAVRALKRGEPIQRERS